MPVQAFGKFGKLFCTKRSTLRRAEAEKVICECDPAAAFFPQWKPLPFCCYEKHGSKNPPLQCREAAGEILALQRGISFLFRPRL
jgi:hypothetical protein